MLANQVKIPELQVPSEPVKTNEIKSSRDNSSSRNFDRLMQDGRREQQEYNRRQQESRRQADAKEANTPKEQNVRSLDKPERTDHRKEDSVENVRHDGKPVEQKQQKEQSDEHESRRDSDKIVHEEDGTEAPAENVKKAEPASVEEELDKAEKSETSQWLDTILSIATDTEADTGEATQASEPEPTIVSGVKDTDSDTPQKPSIPVDTKVSLLLVQQVLAENNSDQDLSELEGQSEVTLAQLKSLLSEADFKAVLAQVSADTTPAETNTEDDFEALLAKVFKGDTTPTFENRPTSSGPSMADVLNQIKSTTQDTQVTTPVAQATAEETDKETNVKPVAASILQGEKVALDLNKQINQQDKFKQSSLMNAMQLNTEVPTETDDSKAESVSNVTVKPAATAETLAPTTKVIDLGSTTTAVNASDKAQNIGLSALNGAVQNAENKELKLDSNELDMLDVRSKESSESKLASLLGQLGGEEVKTSDLANRAEKVNVAGVTLDKTLQMPKLESIAQAKNEVVVRQNILFNKQELAAQMQTHVGMMMAKNMKSVDIRLDPPELGSMQVKLSVQNDQASVSFVVSSQQAKDALENSLPKLKELLEQQGLELADSDVNEQGAQPGSGEDDEQNGIAKNGLNGEEDAADADLEQQQQMINQAINSPWNVSYYA